MLTTLLLLSGLFIFIVGIFQCIWSRHFLSFLFGIELMINASNVNLASFLHIFPYRADIEPLIVMIIAFAALESVVGLALFSWAAKHLNSIGSPLSFSA